MGEVYSLFRQEQTRAMWRLFKVQHAGLYHAEIHDIQPPPHAEIMRGVGGGVLHLAYFLSEFSFT